MKCRHWINGALVASGVFLLLGGVTPSSAQSVESIMSAREQLQLTDEQVQQLDAIRREAVSLRSAEMAETAELRSQLEAGQIRRSQLMAVMEDQQVARQARAEERRASIDSILTEAQREQVLQLRRRGDRDRPGGGRRFAPGRGPGLGPDAIPPAPPAPPAPPTPPAG